MTKANIEIGTLNSAQLDFCARSIPGFDLGKYEISIAGRAGSNRDFLRIRPNGDIGSSRILITWTSKDPDWDRFIRINEEVGLFMPILPEIYATDAKQGLILEEDCGLKTLKDYCSGVVSKKEILTMYEKVLDKLIAWQSMNMPYSSVLSSRALDEEQFIWESDYFSTHCASQFFGLDELLTDSWEKERKQLAAEVAEFPLVCLHRDFQSENIVLHNGNIKFVDFQGARLGAAEYDLASLLFDPYAIRFLDDDLRTACFNYYRGNANSRISHASYQKAALQRLMQALGAYGNLSLNCGKTQYSSFIPPALTLLKSVLDGNSDFPSLMTIIEACIERGFNFYSH